MSEIRYETAAEGEKVLLQVFGLDHPGLTPDEIRNQFKLTEFRNYFLNEDAVEKACKIFKNLQVESRKSETPPTESAASPAVALIVAEKRKAFVEIELSEDKMQCFLTVETSYGDANPTAAELTRYLQENGIAKGIKDKLLQALETRLGNVPPGTRTRDIVAEGQEPGESVPTGIEFQVIPIEDRLMKPQLRGDGTVDMHDFGEIQIVQPGEILVVRTPPVIGAPGFNVTGDVISAVVPPERNIQVGEGTELVPGDPNRLRAARKGLALRQDNGMAVADAYCVGDVDLKTGNIQFDGTVLVQGSVREGLSVKATGDVMVRDYVESSTVVAGGNLIIGKGILGRQAEAKNNPDHVTYTASVSCGNNLHANYAQYAEIDVGGTATITKHLMHCRTTAQDIVVVSPKKMEGKVLGGILWPTSRLECNVLGAPSYIPTLVDFSRRFAPELQELKDLNMELGERVNVVRGMRGALRQMEVKVGVPEIEEQTQKIMNTISHFENLIRVLKQRREQLIQTIGAIRDSFEVEVHKILYPGVSLRFVEREFPVKDEKTGCKLKAKGDTLAYFSLL